MTLPARTSVASITYAVPSGSASSGGTYNITYNFLNNDEFVNVWYRNANSEKVELTLDSDFRIDISSGTNNVYGVCVLLKDIPNITSITLERSIAISQDIDFNNSTLYPSITEYAFDKLTAIAQDQDFKDYTIHAPSDEVVTDPRKFELPPESERLGKIVGFNGVGKVAMYDPPATESQYTPATRTELGAVIIGDNLEVDNLGLINVSKASGTEFGVVKIGTGISVNDGTISVDLSTISTNAETAKTNSIEALANASSAKISAESARDTAEKTADLLDWYVDGQWQETTLPVENATSGTYGIGSFVLTHGNTRSFSYSTSISSSSISWNDGMFPVSNKTWKDITSITAKPGESWTRSEENPSGTFYGIAQKGSRTIIVGEDVCAYSDDEGKNWTANTGLTGHYSSVVNVQGTIVATGYGVASHSSDGSSWTPATSFPSYNFTDSAVLNASRVVTVAQNQAAYSDDGGDIWSSATTPPLGILKGITSNSAGDKVITVGTGVASYSSDGDTWTAATTPPTGVCLAVISINTRIVTVGDNFAAYSDDNGDTWTPATTQPSGYFTNISKIGNRLVITGLLAACAYSDDYGDTWVQGINLPTGQYEAMLTIDDKKLLSVGHSVSAYSEVGGTIFVTAAEEGDILRSYNIIGWKGSTLSSPGSWDFVIGKGGTVLAVGETQFAYSLDGASTFTVETAPWNTKPSCVTASDSNFFVGFSNSTTIYKSSTGISFTTTTLPSGGAEAMCAGNGKIVVLKGSSYFCTTDEGDNWASGSVPGSAVWADVKFGGNRFVAIPTNKKFIIYCSDDMTWHISDHELPTSSGWIKLLYGNMEYLALNSSGNTAEFKVSLDIVQTLEVALS